MVDTAPTWTESAVQYDVELMNEFLSDVGVSDNGKRKGVLDGSMTVEPAGMGRLKRRKRTNDVRKQVYGVAEVSMVMREMGAEGE